jgi:hypothetical protein
MITVLAKASSNLSKIKIYLKPDSSVRELLYRRVWLWVPQGSEPRITVLAKIGSKLPD